MKKKKISVQELLERGYHALIRELGVDGMVQFLIEIRCGRGDYTRDRHLWLDNVPFSEIAADVLRLEEEAKAAKRRRHRPAK